MPKSRDVKVKLQGVKIGTELPAKPRPVASPKLRGVTIKSKKGPNV